MSLLFRIAFRNLFRHKGKTSVIALIIFFGAFLLTLGSGVIGGLNHGLQKNMVDSFTGDVILLSDKQNSEAIFGGTSAQTLESITNYPGIKKALPEAACVDSFLPVGIGYVWVLHDTGQPIEHYLLGVDFDAYKAFFKSHLTILEGQYPGSHERGLLVSAFGRDYINDYSGKFLHPKDQIVFLGLSDKNSSLDIACDVTGIFRYPSLNKLLGYFSIVDIESFRECMGYFTSKAKAAPPTKVQETVLSADNPDALFDLSLSGISESSRATETLAKMGAPKRDIMIPSNWEEGAFNVILVRLKHGISPNEGVEQLTHYFKEHHIPLKAVTWSRAIGIMGQMATIMKSALYVFVGFIFFVAAMIMMNTLSMAAMERVTEIGMMRAVGAKRRFISGMFIIETFILATQVS